LFFSADSAAFTRRPQRWRAIDRRVRGEEHRLGSDVSGYARDVPRDRRGIFSASSGVKALDGLHRVLTW